MKPAVFLDRDGVIIANRPDYVRTWADVAFLPGTVEALARLASFPVKVVICTNQSAVGRGIVDLATAVNINERLIAHIEEAGGRIDGLYMCPHTPHEGCDCRKPRPGLLLQAARELDLNMQQSLMVGDALTDMLAARRAGLAPGFLVQTGRGPEQLLAADSEDKSSFRTAPCLMDVVRELEISYRP